MTQAHIIYHDRWGRPHRPDAASIIKPRRGIFALCMTADKHVLLSWPRTTPDVAELPGGGIEDGEEIVVALQRELAEETTIDLHDIEPVAAYTQYVNFYVEGLNEFWDYEQTFWFLKGVDIDAAYFEGERAPPDALRARWIRYDDLSSTLLHAKHRKGLSGLRLAELY